MVTNIFHHIADQLASKNQYFQKYHPIALQGKDGKVYAFTTESEKQYCGLDDGAGTAFYIRINPRINYRPAARQLTSNGLLQEIIVDFRIVCFTFQEPRFNPLVLAEKIRVDLNGTKFGTYSGTEKSLKVRALSSLSNQEEIYAQETLQKYEGNNDWSCCMVIGQLTYNDTETNCAEACEVFDKYLGCIVESESFNQNSQPPPQAFCDRVAECDVIQQLQQDVEENEQAIENHESDTNNPHQVTAQQVGAATELYADNVALTAENNAKAYADLLVAGLLDLRGVHDASTGLFPAAGGSGPAGAVMKGDLWFVSVSGNLNGQLVTVGDFFFALVDTPGQTVNNWAIGQVNITYVPLNKAGDTLTGGLIEADVSIAAADINWQIGNSFYKTVTGNLVFTFSNLANGQCIRVHLSSNSSAGHTLTWPAGILWGNLDAVQTMEASKTIVFTFTRSNGVIYASYIESF